ncbi:flagellar filament capping protein FliD [[Clostridium] colinum]|uniref:flagellar filament capping protein FliD n=1 Tax=[Clostridium] colinum TaxID=36835 RepID=UPI0020242E02|nr:flagellar filament capping protein FliD [[Clostridium] colinum]
MAIYTSNANRVTGLSGLDIDGMIDKLMQAEGAKYKRLEKEKISVTWEQEAFGKLITSMQSFQDKWLGTSVSNNIGYNSFWNNYTNSVKDANTGLDSNVIKINNTSNSGNYNINVIQKAETETLTGGNISTNIITDKSISDITNIINKYGDISLNLNLDGVTKEIKITKDEINGKQLDQVFNDKVKQAFGTTDDGNQKVVASNENGKLVLKAAGEGHSLSVSEGKERTEGVSFKDNGALDSNATSFEITIDGYTAKVDFSSEDNTEDKKLAKIQKALKEATKLGGTEKKDLSSYVSISREGSDLVIKNNSKSSETTVDIKVNGSSQQQILNPTGSVELVGFKNSSTSVGLNSKLSNVFGQEFEKLFTSGNDEFKLNFGGKDVVINKDDTIQSLMNKVNSSEGGVKISFNEVTNRFTLQSSQSGSSGNIQINDQATKDFLKNITKIDVENKESNAKYIKGQDAEFEIDGIKTTRPSNDVTMNGISFTINGTGKVNMSATNDVDGAVKKIKEFVDDYNKLVTEFNNAFTENRPRSGKYGYYEPLTDEEKKALSDDQIKKYEEQAKKGLLYKDENLNNFLTSLRDNIYKSVDIGGKTISLHEIGITTTKNYNDGGKLQIDEEKLRKALQERGDEVKQLFTKSGNGIADSIKKDINDAIGSKGYLRQKAGIKGTTSATNNDLTKELKEITKKLSEERERLQNKEIYYFKLFSKMEAAMTKKNNQMAAILGMSGQ